MIVNYIVCNVYGWPIKSTNFQNIQVNLHWRTKGNGMTVKLSIVSRS